MALTEKLGIVVDTWALTQKGFDLTREREATDEVFEAIRTSPDFPKSERTRLLDVGSCSKGSSFVNRYGEEFPNVEITYLDNYEPFIAALNKPNKVCADATAMPFPDEHFDIVYTNGVIANGILKRDESMLERLKKRRRDGSLIYIHKTEIDAAMPDRSYRIAKEAYRISKKRGLFIFALVEADEEETKRNLTEIGFGELRHLLREKWCGGWATDTYLARK